MIFWVCNGLHFTLCHFCNQSEVKSNFPALGNLSSICFELWLVHLIICVFFLWLVSVVAIVLLDWNHPSSFTKGKYFPRSYKSSRRNNRKKKIKARMRIKDSQTPVHSVPPYHVVKSQQNLHRLISAYLANLVTTSVNQHSFVTISATQPCKSCIRLTIPNSKVTVLF